MIAITPHSSENSIPQKTNIHLLKPAIASYKC